MFWPDLSKDHREPRVLNGKGRSSLLVADYTVSFPLFLADNAIWRILGRPCSDEHWPAETGGSGYDPWARSPERADRDLCDSYPGQVVFDKRGNNGLNLAVLHLANHMMTSPDLYGNLGYGDKDTFVSRRRR